MDQKHGITRLVKQTKQKKERKKQTNKHRKPAMFILYRTNANFLSDSQTSAFLSETIGNKCNFASDFYELYK